MRILILNLTILLSLQLAAAALSERDADAYRFFSLCKTDGPGAAVVPSFDMATIEKPYVDQRIADFKQVADSIKPIKYTGVGVVVLEGTVDDNNAAIASLQKMIDIYNAFLTAFTTKTAYFMHSDSDLQALAAETIVTYTNIIIDLIRMIEAAKLAVNSLTGPTFDLARNALSPPIDSISAFELAAVKPIVVTEISAKLDPRFVNYLKLVTNVMHITYSSARTAIESLLDDSLQTKMVSVLHKLNLSHPDPDKKLPDIIARAHSAYNEISESLKLLFGMLPPKFYNFLYDIMVALANVNNHAQAVLNFIANPEANPESKPDDYAKPAKIIATRLDSSVLDFTNATTTLTNMANEATTKDVMLAFAFIQYTIACTSNMASYVLDSIAMIKDQNNISRFQNLSVFSAPVKVLVQAGIDFFNTLNFEVDINKILENMKDVFTAPAAALSVKVGEFAKNLRIKDLH